MSAMSTWRWQVGAALVALATLAAGGCPSPSTFRCWPGNDYDLGPGCVVPRLTAVVDGDGAEWTAFVPQATGDCPGDCMVAGDLVGLAAAHDDDGLLVRLWTRGAPLTTAEGYYQLVFYGPGATERADVLLLDVTAGTTWLYLNGFEVVGFDFDVAYGPDGLELRVPFAALPFFGGTLLNASAYAASNEPLGNTSVFPLYACWDPAATMCAIF